MKMKNNLACAMTYAYGVPKRIVLQLHKSSHNILEVMNNQDLVVARYAAYIRQYLITSRYCCNERSYNEALQQKRISFKDENLLAEAMVYLVDNKLLNIDNRNKYKQFDQMNTLFMNTITKFLREFVVSYYDFKIDYLLEILNFNLSPQAFNKLNIMFSGENYSNNIKYYPYSRIMNISGKKMQNLNESERKSIINIFNSDVDLLKFIYRINNDNFVTTTTVETKEVKNQMSFEEFMTSESDKMLFVDCENTNLFKIAEVINNFNKTYPNKLIKVNLINDFHIDKSQTDWNKLSELVDIPVKYIEVKRIITNKSLVDHALIATITKEYYEHKCDVLIATSDSDFYVISEFLSDAKICFLYEKGKVSDKFKRLLRVKENLIGENMDKYAPHYAETVVPILLEHSINILNIVLGEQLLPAINSALESEKIYDDDGSITEKLKDAITSLAFKVDSDKLLIYKK